jgi:hypothetical protein
MSSMKIQNSVVQTFPNEKLTIRQNVELDECSKLCIHDFSIWDNLGFGQRVCSSRYIFLYDFLFDENYTQLAFLVINNKNKKFYVNMM